MYVIVTVYDTPIVGVPVADLADPLLAEAIPLDSELWDLFVDEQ